MRTVTIKPRTARQIFKALGIPKELRDSVRFASSRGFGPPKVRQADVVAAAPRSKRRHAAAPKTPAR